MLGALTTSNNHSSLKFVAAGIALALAVAACSSDSESSTGTAVPVANSAAPTVGTDAPPAGGTDAPDGVLVDGAGQKLLSYIDCGELVLHDH